MDDISLILRISDSYTGRTATIRLEASDQHATLDDTLEKYLRNSSEGRLLESGSITSESLRSLAELRDLVYSCDDEGALTGIYTGIEFRRPDNLLDREGPLPFQESRVGERVVNLAELTVDRTNAGYDRNWTGFHRRRWNNDPGFYSRFVEESLEAALGPEDSGRALSLDSFHDRALFLKTLAKRIWDAPFENYSRFSGRKLMFKTGDETVRNIVDGAGGICTEKVQALKFLTDHYGFESEYLIGGDGARPPVPLSRLREMLQTFDFRFTRRYMRYWQHAALIYFLDGQTLLVDASNGNIPFLFLQGREADALLRDKEKEHVRVRMVEVEEEYFYHCVPQDIPQNLFFAMEGWITDADLVQVFENELGLFLSSDFYVMPVPYRSGTEFERAASQYRAIARRAGFDCQVSREWTLCSGLGWQFASQEPQAAEGILASRDHLLLRYNEWDVPGHDAGLALMRLSG